MMNDFDRNIHCLLGLPVDAVDMAQAMKQVRASAQKKTPCFLSTPNLNFLIACQKDSKFRDAVINSDLSTADGMPLVWLARLLGIPIAERVAGSDLFEQLRKDSASPLSVYFFGRTRRRGRERADGRSRRPGGASPPKPHRDDAAARP